MRALVRFLADNKRFLIGLILFLIICLLALFQPLLVRWRLGEISPMTTGTYPLYVDPNTENLLGTDRMGRDVFSVLLVGLRYSLMIGLLAGSIATFLGILVGFIAGFQGGRIDSALRTFTDMFLVIPTFPILVTLSAYLRGMNVVTMAILLAIFSWPFSARAIRSQVLSLRLNGAMLTWRVLGWAAWKSSFRDSAQSAALPRRGAGGQYRRRHPGRSWLGSNWTGAGQCGDAGLDDQLGDWLGRHESRQMASDRSARWCSGYPLLCAQPHEYWVRRGL
ncbi:MAG: ABC transporter permease [Caldilineaceae bacterium]